MVPHRAAGGRLARELPDMPCPVFLDSFSGLDMTTSSPANTSLMANAIRALAMDAVQQANSGHPGMPMGMAEIGVALWSRHLRHNPTNPTGRTATASCCPTDMVRCCCTRCCI